MADYPQAIYDKATAALLSLHDLHPDWAATLARAALEAVAADLGEHAAGKIAAHRDAYGPQDGARLSGWRRHFGIAARIAARAFLTEDDLKQLAAEALARGDYMACDIPEDPGA